MRSEMKSSPDRRAGKAVGRDRDGMVRSECMGRYKKL